MRRMPVAADSWLRVAGLWVVALKILLVLLVMDPQGDDSFALPKSTVSRGLMYVLLAICAAYLARHRPRLRPNALAIAVLVLLGTCGIATILALDPHSALFGAYRRGLGLLWMADGAVTAGAVALFVRKPSDVVVLAGSAAAALLAIAAYELIQLTGNDPIRWVEPVIGSFVGNSTSLGGTLAVASAILVVLLLLLWGQLRGPVRAALGVAAVASAALTLGTSARAPTLSLVPGMLSAVAFAWRARAIPLRREAVLLAATVVIVVSAVLATGPMRERLSRLVSGDDTSTLERVVIYEAAVKGIASRPLFGVGPDGMGASYLAFRRPQTAEMVFLTATQTSTHSWMLHYALGTGVIGLLAFCAMVGIALARAWHRAREPDGLVAAVGAVGVLAFLAQGSFTINGIVTDTLLWVCLGLVAATYDPVPRVADVEVLRGVEREDRGLASIALVVGLVVAMTIWGSLEANRLTYQSNSARVQGRLAAAQTAAQTAVDKDPTSANAWNVLGLAYSRREPQRAAEAFARAAERARRDPVYLMNLAAEALIGSGGADASSYGAPSALARRAVELDPHGVVTLRRAAEVLRVARRPDEALSLAMRARDLRPDDFDVRAVVGQLLADLGRPLEAVDELEKAISLNPALAKVVRIDLPIDVRRDLSRAYLAAGRTAEAHSLMRPPFVTGIDVSCAPRNGTDYDRNGNIRPRCLRVHFGSEAPLIADATSEDSALSPRSYTIDDRPLPSDTMLEFDGSRIVTLHFPASSVPPAGEALVTVSGVRNELRQPIVPDPARLRIP